MSTADAANDAASRPSSQLGPTAATAIEPIAKPARIVSWPIALSNDLPTGNRSASSRWARLAARAPAKIGATTPVTNRSASRPATGIPGHSIAAIAAAQMRSQQTRTGRAGNRSAMDESTAPPSAYGRNEQTRTSADNSGDRVRSKIMIASATSAATDPAIETPWAMKIGRRPGTRRTEL
jgi:hypothetical protein